MFRFLYEQYPALIGSALALLLILWPPPRQARNEARRRARLNELQNGLETYGPNTTGPYRFWGILILLLSLSLLLLNDAPVNGGP